MRKEDKYKREKRGGVIGIPTPKRKMGKMDTDYVHEKCCFCVRDSKFEIRRIKTGEYCRVCSIHDNHIGVENLMLLGYSNKDAKELNKEVKSQLPNLYNDEFIYLSTVEKELEKK